MSESCGVSRSRQSVQDQSVRLNVVTVQFQGVSRFEPSECFCCPALLELSLIHGSHECSGGRCRDIDISRLAADSVAKLLMHRFEHFHTLIMLGRIPESVCSFSVNLHILAAIKLFMELLDQPVSLFMTLPKCRAALPQKEQGHQRSNCQGPLPEDSLGDRWSGVREIGCWGLRGH